jgi:hypothetical protein
LIAAFLVSGAVLHEELAEKRAFQVRDNL